MTNQLSWKDGQSRIVFGFVASVLPRFRPAKNSLHNR